MKYAKLRILSWLSICLGLAVIFFDFEYGKYGCQLASALTSVHEVKCRNGEIVQLSQACQSCPQDWLFTQAGFLIFFLGATLVALGFYLKRLARSRT